MTEPQSLNNGLGDLSVGIVNDLAEEKSEQQIQTQSSDSIAAFMEEMRGKFSQVGKDLGRLRDKLEQPSKSATPKTKTEHPGDTSRDELFAAVRYGEVVRDVPKTVRDQLDGMLREGRSFADVMLIAEMIKTSLAETATEVRQPTPAGVAASAPSRTTQALPDNWDDYIMLMKTNRKLFDEINHPDHPYQPPQPSQRKKY